MINNRNVNIITEVDGNMIVIINDIRFKGKRNIDWDEVAKYLRGYVGDFYEISETAEKIYIGNELVKEFPESNSRTALKGATAKAKANSATAIPELIQIAKNPKWEENKKDKHNKDAKYGWYRYDTRFALPKYDDSNEICGYNIFRARLVVRHAEDGGLYLYDVLRTKKETSRPLEQ